MSEDHDSKITDLYQQSSQETPPAHIDRAVMDRARKSVRRGAYSPFGNHWVAGGAMAAVVVLSVLLILTVPPQPDTYIPGDDAVAPSSDVLSERQKESTQRKALMSEMPARVEEKREEPAAPKARFDFYKALPEMEVVVPKDETRSSLQQAPVAKESASAAATVPVETYYLQAGSFREQARANALKTKLSGLGFKCEIQKVGMDETDVFYRVRVGPFTDHDALDKSRKKLRESGFETQTVKNRE